VSCSETAALMQLGIFLYQLRWNWEHRTAHLVGEGKVLWRLLAAISFQLLRLNCLRTAKNLVLASSATCFLLQHYVYLAHKTLNLFTITDQSF
jgi:hypothetical protein